MNRIDALSDFVMTLLDERDPLQPKDTRPSAADLDLVAEEQLQRELTL